MMSPVKSTIQEHMYKKHIEQIKELTAEANTDLLDIKTKYENNTKTKAHAIYNDLCT